MVLISGNEFSTPINIARVNKDTINTNSINDSLNSSFFIDNTGKLLNVEFDGLTKLLTSKVKLSSNETYHIQFLIAEESDAIHDSGVFIESYNDNFIPDSLSYLKCVNTNIITVSDEEFLSIYVFQTQ